MKFLIVKTSSLGDIIHAFPVISYLKSRFPQALIDWVCEKSFAELVRAHPDILNVFCIETKAWRKSPFSRETFHAIKEFKRDLTGIAYDAVFDLQGNTKSGLVTWMTRSPIKVGFGWNSLPERPNLLFTNRRFDVSSGKNIREDYLSLAQQYFKDDQAFQYGGTLLKLSPEQVRLFDQIKRRLNGLKSPLVMVCPGSNWKNKQLTETTLAAFLQKLQEHLDCRYVFIWGNDQEKMCVTALAEKLKDSMILDRAPLPVLQNVMGLMNLVIAMDSLPLHLAATTTTPTFSIFGASSANKYKPAGVQHISVQGTCPYGRTFEKRCPILRSCPTGACIRGMSIEEIYNKALQIGTL